MAGSGSGSGSWSCSHWWHAPMYLAAVAILAFMAVSSGVHPSPEEPHGLLWHDPFIRQLSLNASSTLRRSGFTIIATLLQLSPEFFFLSPNTTIFAIQDSAISNLSAPLLVLKPLLQYHTSPDLLSIHDLLNKPPGLCLPTLIAGKNIVVSNVSAASGLVQINNVSISHPNLFLAGPIAVHGVLAPFSPSPDARMGWEFIRPPPCRSSRAAAAVELKSFNSVEWTRIIQLLSSRGFVSFAIGLHSVLDRILGDGQRNLSSVTIFSPAEFSYIAAPKPVLEKVVRFHIVPQRLTLMEVAKATSLRTLVPGRVLKVTGPERLSINGVEIAEPEIFVSNKFVVHGISQVLELFQDT